MQKRWSYYLSLDYFFDKYCWAHRLINIFTAFYRLLFFLRLLCRLIMLSVSLFLTLDTDRDHSFNIRISLKNSLKMVCVCRVTCTGARTILFDIVGSKRQQQQLFHEGALLIYVLSFFNDFVPFGIVSSNSHWTISMCAYFSLCLSRSRPICLLCLYDNYVFYCASVCFILICRMMIASSFTSIP